MMSLLGGLKLELVVTNTTWKKNDNKLKKKPVVVGKRKALVRSTQNVFMMMPTETSTAFWRYLAIRR